MTEQKRGEGSQQTGFAGLSSMVSNIDNLIEELSNQTSEQTAAEASLGSAEDRAASALPAAGSKTEPVVQTIPQPSGNSRRIKLMVGIGMVVGLVLLVSLDLGTRATRDSSIVQEAPTRNAYPGQVEDQPPQLTLRTEYRGTVTNSLLPNSPALFVLTLEQADSQSSEIEGVQLAGYVQIGAPLEGSGPAFAVVRQNSVLTFITRSPNGDTIVWTSNELGGAIGGTYAIAGGLARGQSGVWQATLASGGKLTPYGIASTRSAPSTTAGLFTQEELDSILSEDRGGGGGMQASPASPFGRNPQTQRGPARPREEKPPVGRDLILEPSQIRYCLAEDIRIEAGRAAVNNYDGTDVDRFNAVVADYNSRCSSFRYRPGGLERARADIEPYRPSIQEEGRRRAQISSEEIPWNRPDGVNQELPTSALGVQPSTTGERRGQQTPSGRPRSSLGSLPGKPDLSQVSNPEREMIENACTIERQVEGLAKYYGCLTQMLRDLSEYGRKPDLSSVSPSAREMIESACTIERQLEGPAAYYRCVAQELHGLSQFGSKPDLSGASLAERQMMQAACGVERQVEGPAAYYNCLAQQLRALNSYGAKPDLSKVSETARMLIDFACSVERTVEGPAAYYACVSRELRRLNPELSAAPLAVLGPNHSGV
jgi:hypothetical protein